MNDRFGFRHLCAMAATALVLAAPAVQAVSPYIPDADTLHLWHLDEPAGGDLPVINAIDSKNGAGPYNLNVTNGASLMAPGFNPALGGALDTQRGSDDLALNDSGVYALDQNLMGANGSFTYEALVYPTFDPKTNAIGRSEPMSIICFDTESESSVDRFFQFRLKPPVSNEQWSVEFSNIGSYKPLTGSTLIDDFSGSLSDWSSTVILDANGGINNSADWQIAGGGLQLSTSIYDGVEQYAMIKSGITLAVGEEIRADIVQSGSQDIGLYVGGTLPVPGIRQDYVAVYARNTGIVYSRGFDGASEYGLAYSGLNPVAYKGVFVKRTAANTYETGWYDDDTRTVIATRTPTTPNDADVVGVYAHVEALGILGTVTNIFKFSESQAAKYGETFTALLPKTGLHIPYSNTWYHVAVTYNGIENSPNNLTLYWTRLGNSVNQLGAFKMVNDLANVATNLVGEFSVGNECRGTPDQNFMGLIDEVRVSDIDRADFSVLNRVPYTLDINTLLLFHFNETHDPVPENATPVAHDEVASNPLDLLSFDNPVFGTNAYTGLGTSVGFDKVNNPGNRLAAFLDTPLSMSNFVDAATGAFTFEAVIQPQWTGPQTEVMNIMTAEGNGGTIERPFQFRIQTDGTTLRFDPIATRLNGGNTAVLDVALPSTGLHALAAGNWYHVAIAYNGNEGATDNVTFYWTRLDSGATEANVLANFTSAGDLINPAHAGEFCIGNELRNFTGNGYDVEEFIGNIDEVRISKVARAADRFLFNTAAWIDPYDIVSIQISGGNASLIWQSQAGVSYGIQRKTALTEETWATVTNGIPSAGDGTTSVVVPVSGAGEEFYQVSGE